MQIFARVRLIVMHLQVSKDPPLCTLQPFAQNPLALSSNAYARSGWELSEVSTPAISGSPVPLVVSWAMHWVHSFALQWLMVHAGHL